MGRKRKGIEGESDCSKTDEIRSARDRSKRRRNRKHRRLATEAAAAAASPIYRDASVVGSTGLRAGSTSNAPIWRGSADADCKVDIDAVVSWERWRQHRCTEMLRPIVIPTAPLRLAPPEHTREARLQTSGEVLRLLFQRLLDPSVVQMLGVSADPAIPAIPNACLPHRTSSDIISEIDAALMYCRGVPLRPGELPGSPRWWDLSADEKFQECAHPWSRNWVLPHIVGVLWPIIVGAEPSSFVQAATGLWQLEQPAGLCLPAQLFEQNLGQVIEEARSKYETGVLVPLICRRLLRVLPCKDLAAVACTYIIDPAHNARRMDSASTALLRSSDFKMYLRQTRAFSVEQLELDMELLDEWMRDLLADWERHRTSAPVVGNDAFDKEAFAILTRWVKSVSDEWEQMRLRIGEIRYDQREYVWWRLIPWRYSWRYPFITKDPVRRALDHLVRTGRIKDYLVIFDAWTLFEHTALHTACKAVPLQPLKETNRILLYLQSKHCKVALLVDNNRVNNDNEVEMRLPISFDFDHIERKESCGICSDGNGCHHIMAHVLAIHQRIDIPPMYTVLFTTDAFTVNLAKRVGITAYHVDVQGNKALTLADISSKISDVDKQEPVRA